MFPCWKKEKTMSDNNEETYTPSEFEKEFQKNFELIKPQIDEQLKIASAAMTKATQLSEEYGIPFYGHVSHAGQHYIPRSIDKKFSEVDRDFLAQLAEMDTYQLNDAYGWEHSQICY